ncbi:hypothetical protein SAMN04487936_11120 [Halobacillus dabanensis]|uniref:Uncharacterized protein n=1 Tax=Halobacillus dabanensis TaxID=240302 RepID=A0A1I3YI93_HALDA|nr:hypothetical protein SAMN04487936_11120 [Halobacillus dabanensis]
MWAISGGIAIVVTVINLSLYAAGKDYKLAMAMALSFTALTICADYSYLNRWIKAEDWAALTDVVPEYGKGILVFDNCFYLTKSSTYIFRTNT